MNHFIFYIILGLIAGMASGLIGIGGGIILVPALLYVFGLNQHQAQGTTLALMVPPIGLLAAYTYYKAGHVNLKISAFVVIGFFFGGLIGARFANQIPTHVLRRIFAVVMVLVGIYTFIKK